MPKNQARLRTHTIRERWIFFLSFSVSFFLNQFCQLNNTYTRTCVYQRRWRSSSQSKIWYAKRRRAWLGLALVSTISSSIATHTHVSDFEKQQPQCICLKRVRLYRGNLISSGDHDANTLLLEKQQRQAGRQGETKWEMTPFKPEKDRRRGRKRRRRRRLVRSR